MLHLKSNSQVACCNCCPTKSQKIDIATLIVANPLLIGQIRKLKFNFVFYRQQLELEPIRVKLRTRANITTEHTEKVKRDNQPTVLQFSVPCTKYLFANSSSVISVVIFALSLMRIGTGTFTPPRCRNSEGGFKRKHQLLLTTSVSFFIQLIGY